MALDEHIANNLRIQSQWTPWQQLAAEHAHDEDIVAFCQQQAGDEPAGRSGAPGLPEGAPKASGSKKDWVAYAIEQGVDAAEVEGLTRDQLVERFTVNA